MGKEGWSDCYMNFNIFYIGCNLQAVVLVKYLVQNNIVLPEQIDNLLLMKIN